MVEKMFCDVCGDEIPKFRDSRVFVHLPKPTEENPDGWGIYSADLCLEHGKAVKEFVEGMISEAAK